MNARTSSGLQIGETGQLAAWTILRTLNHDTCHQVTQDLVGCLGMTCQGLHSAAWAYPAFGGGGVGFIFPGDKFT